MEHATEIFTGVEHTATTGSSKNKDDCRGVEGFFEGVSKERYEVETGIIERAVAKDKDLRGDE